MNTSAKERKDFTLLITGSRDNDRAAEIAAAPGMETVHCKFSYAPMYEKYGEIKKFQLKLRDTDYTRGRRICCAADLSEWVGHENEELFTVTLKYFHDHRSRFDYIFTVGEHTEDEVREMYFRMRCFMSGRILRDSSFLETGALINCIRGKGISGEVAALLSEMIMDDSMEALRAYPTVDIMCSELRTFAYCFSTKIQTDLL